MSTASDTPAPKPKGRVIYKMRIDKICDYTDRIRELFLKCDEPNSFQFRAGQFVMLHVPAQPKALLRAYSIATAEQDQSGYRLIFNYVDQGAASEFIWKAKEGDILDFTGPFGRLFFQEPPTEQVVFLNTGSGVSQHFSYLETNIEKHPNVKYRLLFGVRSEKDVYYEDELKRLQSKLKDFKYEYILSRPSDAWTGRKGYVQNFIDDFDVMNVPTTFYLCGNGGMIKDLKAKLIEKGFDMTKVFAEAFD